MAKATVVVLSACEDLQALAVTCSSSRSSRVRDAVHCSWVPGTGSTRQPRVRRQTEQCMQLQATGTSAPHVGACTPTSHTQTDLP